jgi:CBS domain-containing membrane protein
MSRNLITVKADTTLGEVADLFRRHRFTSLPVVGPDQKFLGVIFQIHLIGRAREDALRLDRGFVPALKRLVDRRREKPVLAGDIMSVTVPRALATTPLSAFLPLMGNGEVDAVPVLDYGRIIGIVTRTDLIAAMARRIVRGSATSMAGDPASGGVAEPG